MARNMRGMQVLAEVKTLLQSYQWARMDVHGRLLTPAGPSAQVKHTQRAPGVAERLQKGEAAYKWLAASLDAIELDFGKPGRNGVLSVLKQFQTLQLRVEQLRAAEVEKDWLSNERAAGSTLQGLDEQWELVMVRLAQLEAFVFGSADSTDPVGMAMVKTVGELESAINNAPPQP